MIRIWGRNESLDKHESGDAHHVASGLNCGGRLDPGTW